MHHQVIGKSRLGIPGLLAAVLVACACRSGALAFHVARRRCGGGHYLRGPRRPSPSLSTSVSRLPERASLLQPSALTGAGIATTSRQARRHAPLTALL